MHYKSFIEKCFHNTLYVEWVCLITSGCVILLQVGSSISTSGVDLSLSSTLTTGGEELEHAPGYTSTSLEENLLGDSTGSVQTVTTQMWSGGQQGMVKHFKDRRTLTTLYTIFYNL